MLRLETELTFISFRIDWNVELSLYRNVLSKGEQISTPSLWKMIILNKQTDGTEKAVLTDQARGERTMDPCPPPYTRTQQYWLHRSL